MPTDVEILSKKLPNLLIVGAAKCGTSSLHKYLDQHPEIFMSKVKEPRFISSQVTPFPLNGPGEREDDHRERGEVIHKSPCDVIPAAAIAVQPMELVHGADTVLLFTGNGDRIRRV